MIDWIVNLWALYGQTILGFFNSSFISNLGGAAIGALFGAWFGAQAAQRIAERNKLRDETLKAISDVNTAILLAVSVCNSLLALKKQHTKALFEEYSRTRTDLIEKVKRGAEITTAKMEMNTLPSLHLPMDELEAHVFRSGVGSRGLAAALNLRSSMSELTTYNSERNTLIQEFKTMGSSSKLIAAYFAFKQPNGETDRRYFDLVDAINMKANEGIFFSHQLYEDLVLRAKAIKLSASRKLRNGLPGIREANFAEPLAAGLIPSKEEYADWLRGFVAT